MREEYAGIVCGKSVGGEVVGGGESPLILIQVSLRKLHGFLKAVGRQVQIVMSRSKFKL